MPIHNAASISHHLKEKAAREALQFHEHQQDDTRSLFDQLQRKEHRDARSARGSVYTIQSIHPSRASGDHHEKRRKSSAAKRENSACWKTALIAYFVLYAVFIFLYFGVNVFTMITLCFFKMKYYVRPGDFYEVVSDVPELMLKFTFGALLHFFGALYTIFVLTGARRTENLVLRFQERYLVWLMGVAVIGEMCMSSSTYQYFTSRPEVKNGWYEETIYPVFPNEEFQSCFKPEEWAKLSPRNPYIRANLAWVVNVLCRNHRGRKIQKQLWAEDATPSCIKLKESWKKDEEADCSLVKLVNLFNVSYVVLVSLGLIFCIALLFTFVRAEVKTRPGRFSLTEPATVKELTELMDAAEKVKKFTYQQMMMHELVEDFEKDKEKEKQEETAPEVEVDKSEPTEKNETDKKQQEPVATASEPIGAIKTGSMTNTNSRLSKTTPAKRKGIRKTVSRTLRK